MTASAPPASPLGGKIALVTGSSRGLGRETALELARRGATVIVHYAHSAGPADAVVKEISALGQTALALKADISKPADIAALFADAVAHFGRLDIVVSNAGREHFGPIESVTPEEFDAVFAVNTRGQFFVAQQAYKHLQEGGRLVLTSSISAQARGVRNHAVYSGSKNAIEAFARCLSTDFGPKKITVNAIAPGGVKTDMYTESVKEYIPGSEDWSNAQIEAAVAKLTPLGRAAYPTDVARVIAFLVSEDAGWVNGSVGLLPPYRTSAES